MKKKYIFTYFVVPSIALSFVLSPFVHVANAQVDPTDPKVIQQRENELRAELERIEKEKAEVQKTLTTTRTAGASLERDVNILTGEIRRAELNIKEKNLRISTLEGGIVERQKTVAELESKIEKNKESLADLMRKTNYIDDFSLPEFFFAGEQLSDFFIDIDDFGSIKREINGSFAIIREARGEVLSERELLEKEQVAEIDTKKSIEAEKRTVAQKQTQKSSLLSINKQTAKGYEQVIAEKERQAAAIRDALFSLRDASGISFGQALEYANVAGKATGVRPAFILAILKQESNLGQNVGTCNRASDPDSKKYYNIMPGPNDNSWRDDQTIFLEIAKKLGRDPLDIPLSCPLNASTWGGAMGPSQFIPATWKSYEAKIAAALGVALPNPWNPRHAFTATALYVKDLGASSGGFTAERTAALKYYAGGSWSLPANAFYGDQVMGHTANFQTQIEFLDDVEN